MMEDTLDFDTSPLGQILNELDQSELEDLESSAFPDLEPNLDVDLGLDINMNMDIDMDIDMNIDTEEMDSLAALISASCTPTIW